MSLESSLSNDNTEIEDQLLDKNQSLTFFDKGKLSYCEDNGSLKIDNWDNQDSYKKYSFCKNLLSSLNTTKDLEVIVIPKLSNPTSFVGSISSTSAIKAQQSDSCLQFNSADVLDSHGPSIYMYNDTNIIDRDVKR